jgi:hypothetical protein
MYDATGAPIGRYEIDFYHPFNPGNVLAFNPVDVNGQHANRTRAGEFALYDEYDPLREILLDASGNAVKWAAGTAPPMSAGQFFLNFDATQGPASTLDPTKKTDGDDKIFGDNGNDWIVGGTGRDDMYGGWGNDLLNANDDLTTDNGLNDVPVTSASYEDRAFGGAGRDVMIANTGGDRLIDWTGEYNTYLVPFSPFGMATISRTLQPALQDFLYALSKSDGADFTRAADTASDPARNGEPKGELGLVLQQDAAWHDQHGGPSDPQPGNIGGTARDVLRTANFNTGTAQGMNPQVGTFSIVNNRYQVAPAASTPFGDAISLFDASDTVLPDYFEMQATINALKPTGGIVANAYLIFDWQSNSNFKFAGINVSNNQLQIGHYDGTNWVVDNWTNQQLKPATDYVVMLKVNFNTVTLVQGTTSVSYTYAARVDSAGVKHNLKDGETGIATRGGTQAQMDDLVVQAPPGAITLDKTVDFGATSPASGLFFVPAGSTWTPTGTWTTTSDGHFVGTAASAAAPAVNLMGYGIAPGAMIDLSTTLRTGGQGGIVFDYQGPSYYKYVTLSADSKQIVIGHATSSGTVIDKTYAMSVSANTDYVLGVNVRGSLVNVSINGGVVVSNIFNETSTTYGGYGFISMKGATSGTSSFDIVRLRTDDAQYGTAPAPLMAAAVAPQGSSTASVAVPSASELHAIVLAAEDRWAQSGLDAASLAKMDSVMFSFADLDGQSLGQESGDIIQLDLDAAGWGWFVDKTPGDDSEFRSSGGMLTASNAQSAGHIDLLTVVEHELGHAAGLGHEASGVMAPTLAAGVRLTPVASAPASAYGSYPIAPVVVSNISPSSGPVLIDWGITGSSTDPVPVKKNVPAAPLSWQGDFVSYLGQTEKQRNPNQALRLHIDANGKIASSLNSL